MANNFPTSLNNYPTGVNSEKLSDMGHCDEHNQLEAKLGTGASTPTNGKVLTGNGVGSSEWATPAASVSVTTKGDLQTFSTVADRLPVGTDGQILESRSTKATGINWIAAPVIPVNATALENVTGTDNTKFLTAFANVPAFNSSMARQAIINGNFDIWQRGITNTNPTSTTYPAADRYKVEYIFASPPTNIIHSRQILTPGDIPNSYFYYRIAPDGAGTLAAGTYYLLHQYVENGVRNLCGNGKKITVSFWARSSIANKRLSVEIEENYGTGGSPSAVEDLTAQLITLSSSWTKYTMTFTTNTLVGKTFGTNNDDNFRLTFWLAWGSTYQSRVGAASTESFIGSGNIDIAQVQLCAGDVALPFQPKSYAQELIDCKRYYQKWDSSLGAYTFCCSGYANSTTQAYVIFPHSVRMRIPPTAIDISTVSYIQIGGPGWSAVLNALYLDVAGVDFTGLDCRAASGMTAGSAVRMLANNSTAAYVGFTAEL